MKLIIVAAVMLTTGLWSFSLLMVNQDLSFDYPHLVFVLVGFGIAAFLGAIFYFVASTQLIAPINILIDDLQLQLDENQRLMEEQKAVYLRVIQMAAKAIEAKDEYTYGHAERVSVYARWTAVEYGLDNDTVEKVAVAGRLHDLGKIGLQDAVLFKNLALDESEYELVKRHPLIGQEILQPLGLDPEIMAGIGQHHERWDGGGYPLGLKKDQISVFAQIIAVADTYDAMTSTRPYREAMSQEQALAELQAHTGTQFDARVVDAFIRASHNSEPVWLEMRTHLHRKAGYKIESEGA